ncbi:uncharacterized protein DNG_09586 [Cephalotrichum gorgonifer]|uniref:2EXR domain-containing protein n=1 Tax=Cephalotrichum gorgonifer TaxID=2041049 RepID=A0AAE8N647_9PEZI|nr:uncharacterized protein DNG_09586 [Cephalotrichum gorgonifer]
MASTFPQFPHLPLEIRNEIWLAAATEPRVHRVTLSLASAAVGTTPSLHHSTHATRALLSTSHESRAVALVALPDVLPINLPGVVRVSLARDVVCIAGVTPRRLWMGLGAPARARAQVAAWRARGGGEPAPAGLWRTSARRVALEMKATRGGNAVPARGEVWDGDSVWLLARFAAGFDGLEEFYLVPASTGAPARRELAEGVGSGVGMGGSGGRLRGNSPSGDDVYLSGYEVYKWMPMAQYKSPPGSGGRPWKLQLNESLRWLQAAKREFMGLGRSGADMRDDERTHLKGVHVDIMVHVGLAPETNGPGAEASYDAAEPGDTGRVPGRRGREPGLVAWFPHVKLIRAWEAGGRRDISSKEVAGILYGVG